MNIFELLGTAAISIDDPAEMSIAERNALEHLLVGLRNRNREILRLDERHERRDARSRLKVA